MDALHEVKDGAGLDGDFPGAYSNMNELGLIRRDRMGIDKINSRSKKKTTICIWYKVMYRNAMNDRI
jgi:hypothetical protein